MSTKKNIPKQLEVQLDGTDKIRPLSCTDRTVTTCEQNGYICMYRILLDHTIIAELFEQISYTNKLSVR